MHAVVDNKIEIIKALIKMGADINLQDSAGWSALHFTASEYLPEIAKYLIENNAEVDLKDNYGNTPLSTAVFWSRGRGDLIKILLSNGANRDLKNNYDVSPLDLAKNIANYNIIQFFI